MRKGSTSLLFTIGLTIVIITVTVILLISIRQSQRVKSTSQLVNNEQDIIHHIQKIIQSALDNETDGRGYVITGKEEFLNPLFESEKGLDDNMAILKKLLKDKPGEAVKTDSLQHYIDKRIDFSHRMVATRKKNFEEAAQLVASGEGKAYTEHIRRICLGMEDSETASLQVGKDNNERTILTLNIILYSVLSVVALLGTFLALRIRSEFYKQKNNEERFAAFLDAAPDATVITNKGGIIQMVNQQTVKLFGYGKEELIGKEAAILLQPELHKDQNPFYQIDTLAPPSILTQPEIQFTRKNGNSFPAEVTISPIDTKDGVLVSASIRDITERKKAQEQLNYLSLQINRSNDSIYIVDKDLNIISWNQGAENLYGYTKEEALGKNPNELLQTDMTKQQLNHVLTNISRDDYWKGELKRKTKDGKDVYVSSSSTSIKNDKGEIEGYIAVSMNITEDIKLRDQLQHLANLVEQSSEAIMSRGLDNRLLSWNKGAEKLFGYTKEEAIGKKASDLGISYFSPAELEEVNNAVENGSWVAEKTYYHKNGETFTGAVTGNLVKNAWGEPTSTVFVVKDISLRKKLEEQLKLSNEALEEKIIARTLQISQAEKKYRHLFENNPMPMWVMELEHFRFLDVNNMALHQYGYTREEFLSMTALDIRPTEEKDRFLNENRPLNISESEANRGIWKHQRKDGSTLLVEIVAHRIIFEDKPAWLILAIDITEKSLAEEKLKASEKRYRETLDNMLEGVQIIDFDWRYLYINNAAAAQGKQSKENLIGHTFLEKYPGVENTELYKVFERCFKERVSIQMENEFVYPDNSRAWFELSFQPVPEGVFVLSVDVTARKVAEQSLNEERARLKTLSDNLPGVMIFQLTGDETGMRRFTYVSNEVTRLTGRTPEEVLKDPTIMYNMILKEDLPIMMAVERESLAKNTNFNVEVRCDSVKDGIRWLNIISTPRTLHSGQTVWDGFHVDITDRKETEKKMRELNADLEKKVMMRTAQLHKSNEELEAFSYSVSHDLRAPLRAIIGFTSILEEDYARQLDEEARRITGIIRNNTLKMGNLIDDLLTFSRMGRQDIEMLEINMNDMVQQIITEIKSKQSGPDIEWVVPPLQKVKGDINTMRQVWINLLTNAVKYSASKPHQRIELGSYLLDGQAVYYVKDNGVGFDEKYSDKLFKVFQRLHSSAEFEGTGVGLAIVEKIVSKHGGKVWANGTPGIGAIFYFSIPVNGNDELNNTYN